MPAKRLPWFKVWVGATRHEKVATLSDTDFRTWVELLDAGAQQSVRGHFDSAATAAAVVRRPLASVKRLIAARLLDDQPDGVWLHDWPDWQRWSPEDDAIDSRTTPERLTNNTRTTHEQHANVNGTTRDRPSRGAERAKTKDVDVEEDVKDVPRAKALSSASADVPPAFPRISPQITADPQTAAETPPESDQVDAVYEHFKARVQPKSRLCPRKQIAARLKRFTVDELREGIDHFAEHPWWMEHNAARGAGWFFESDQHAEQFLLLQPRASPTVPLRSVGILPDVPPDSPFMKWREVS
jgi:hypothetical protein